MRILAPPGVFRPRSDTWMLADLVAREEGLAGADALDLCTGSGAVAIAAARAGAREVTAVDVSRRAVLAARLNARLNGVRVRSVRGDLFAAVRGRRFRAITANPPYLPGDEGLPTRGAERAWEGGPDGRVVLDRVIAGAPAHLERAGALLLVQSSVCGVEQTLEGLAAGGLEAQVVERRRGPLGPLLLERAGELEARGLLRPGQREEDVVTIRAQAPR